ncbi:MAG: 23S rRNA (guanosine(2251)-2'-O)-methyltransferase RlmB [Candidatus Omnitrophica bacterium]|nr:23S rRNA (guanosine(2251)-2'-O)-methyltransferase RlmB [Candidatus Omnitrophota bacterium]
MKIFGKNPVLERIKSNPKSVRHIYVQAGHPEHSYIALKSKKYGIPVTVVDQRRMLKLSRDMHTQGLLMEVEDFGYQDFDECLETAEADGVTFLFIDGLTDPQNLGAIIRSVACLGGFVLVLPTHDSVHVTDAVMRVACGGENYVQVCKVNNLNGAIQKAKDKGFWIVGSVVKGGEDLRKVKLPFPLGIVVGSEDKGIREVVQQRLDVKVTIPMAQQRMSLNAAHATSMICYETTKQKSLQGRAAGRKVASERPLAEGDLPE